MPPKKHHPRMLGRPPLSRLFAQPAGAEPISCVERCTQRLRARYGRLSARIAISRQKRACCIKVKVSHCRSNMAYKGRPSAKSIAREFPFVVETMVPEAASVATSMTCTSFTVSVGSLISTSLAAETMSTITFDGASRTLTPLKHSRRNFLAR